MKFQEKVWELIGQIPKGKVTTYSIIAKKINSKAYRAVGNACHHNPFAPRIPCHHVVRSDGSIGGYSSGTEKKIELLEKEGIQIKNGKVVNFKKLLHYF